MKRKNLVAMGLAGVMAVGMCMPVMAMDTTIEETGKNDGTPKPGSGTTTVEYVEPVDYALTIPGTVTFLADGSSTITLKVDPDHFALHEDKKVVVTVADADKITLKNIKSDGTTVGSKTYGIQLKTASGTVLTASAEAATFTNDVMNDVALKVVGKEGESFKAAGKYQGDITFNVAYDDITVTP